MHAVAGACLAVASLSADAAVIETFTTVSLPDNLAAFNPAGLDRFTLRQTPIVAAQEVPESSPLLLLGASALGLVLRRRI